MYQTRYVTNRSINRMGLNINKKYDKAYKYYNAKHNITRMLRYINIYMMNGIKLIVHLFAIIVSYLKQIIY